jgi:chemotaxis signal transduction protein
VSALCVRVLVAGEPFGLAVDHVDEVVVVGELTVLPGAPAHMLGVRNLRGVVIPVASAAALLGRAQARPPGRLIACHDGARTLALAVEEVLGVEEQRDGLPLLDVGELFDAAAIS